MLAPVAAAEGSGARRRCRDARVLPRASAAASRTVAAGRAEAVVIWLAARRRLSGALCSVRSALASAGTLLFKSSGHACGRSVVLILAAIADAAQRAGRRRWSSCCCRGLVAARVARIQRHVRQLPESNASAARRAATACGACRRRSAVQRRPDSTSTRRLDVAPALLLFPPVQPWTRQPTPSPEIDSTAISTIRPDAAEPRRRSSAIAISCTVRGRASLAGMSPPIDRLPLTVCCCCPGPTPSAVPKRRSSVAR